MLFTNKCKINLPWTCRDKTVDAKDLERRVSQLERRVSQLEKSKPIKTGRKLDFTPAWVELPAYLPPGPPRANSWQ